MKETRYYKVADHTFNVIGEAQIFDLMANYEPFTCDGGETVFTLTIGEDTVPSYTEELRQEDEGQSIVCGHTDAGLPVFEYGWLGIAAGWLVCKTDYREAHLITTGIQMKMVIDNALMVLFALATANKRTLLFHAATVSYGHHAYMFLGKSGTGKSTHAGLWLKYIGGTELVNDDNPVVRYNGEARVYGSPWSGKTPCYRNVNYQLGGIVLLSQAPYNKIRRLNGIEAYAALVPSISGKRWDKTVADGLHHTENNLAKNVPTWYLECLPDEEAARVCFTSLTNIKER